LRLRSCGINLVYDIQLENLEVVLRLSQTKNKLWSTYYGGFL
jgi:hypothetical protein